MWFLQLRDESNSMRLLIFKISEKYKIFVIYHIIEERILASYVNMLLAK